MALHQNPRGVSHMTDFGGGSVVEEIIFRGKPPHKAVPRSPATCAKSRNRESHTKASNKKAKL